LLLTSLGFRVLYQYFLGKGISKLHSNAYDSMIRPGLTTSKRFNVQAILSLRR
jgi:hypothetical protein